LSCHRIRANLKKNGLQNNVKIMNNNRTKIEIDDEDDDKEDE